LCAGADPQVMPDAKSALIDLEVEFEAGNGRPVEIIAIESIVFAHPVLDLMLLRLETDSAREPLPLADPLAAADARDAPLWIVGYPVTRPSSSEDSKFEAVFGPADAATTGVKRASPGRLQKAPVPPDAGSADVKHDATTLPGSSGSPILDGRTGGLIGLHYRGDAGDSWNMMIYLPNALADGALRDRFDPAVAKDAVRAFPATSGAIDIVEIGRPHVRLMTADDMLEVAVDDGTGPASAAPGEFADSPGRSRTGTTSGTATTAPCSACPRPDTSPIPPTPRSSTTRRNAPIAADAPWRRWWSAPLRRRGGPGGAARGCSTRWCGCTTSSSMIFPAARRCAARSRGSSTTGPRRRSMATT
jgi:hypothetical protein